MQRIPKVVSLWLCCLLLVTPATGLFGQSPSPNTLMIPAYPVLARLAQVEGTIDVQLEFDPAGLVQSLKVQDHDKKLSMLAYSVVTSVSKWRLASQANQKLNLSFLFQLLPFDAKDADLETKIDLFSSIAIKARKSAPIEKVGLHEPATAKQ